MKAESWKLYKWCQHLLNLVEDDMNDDAKNDDDDDDDKDDDDDLRR